MQRRKFNHAALAGLFVGDATGGETVHAQGISSISAHDALAGIRSALTTGAKVAVQQLGQKGGFSENPKVRIGLPGILEDVAPLLKNMGQGKRLDELLNAMNQSAEMAVTLAADLLVKAIEAMTVGDARRILTGGDTSVTDFFADKTRQSLTVQFLPIVKNTTSQVQLADKYQAVAGRAAKLGLMKREDADLPGYVTGRAIDGLYLVIGNEERKIRQNPGDAGSALLKKVFGAI